MTLLKVTIFLIISILIGLLSYFFGIKKGSLRTKLIADNKLQHQAKLFQIQKETYQKNIETLKQQVERYMNFFINIPEAVKNINSQLSFDDLITSIIRLTKVLIKTDQVEIYTFNKDEDCLCLIAALGTNRGRSIKIRVGEGVVGGAAATRMIFTKEQMIVQGVKSVDERLETAAPVIFRKEIFGVIGIGKVKTDDYKIFLSLIADLSAIAFKNCEYLDAAKEEAIRDALTGLYNKQYFYDRGQEILEKSTNYSNPFSIFMFDIDNFKHFNDTNGHLNGDILLKELSMLVKEHTRSTNILSRFGGEEFIILFQNSDKFDAMTLAENLRNMIASHPFAFRDKQPLGCISVSGGIATFPMDGDSIKKLIEHADQALYESKQAGRNRIAQYSEDQSSPVQVF